jgi:hypothetical protein
MIQFNTTTGNFTQLDAPFTPVQSGALVHIPVGDSGVLAYFGGETPVSADAVQNTSRILVNRISFNLKLSRRQLYLVKHTY